MLSGLLTMSSAVADEEGLLTLKGTVIEQACTVDPSDENKMVELGEWSTRKISSPGGHSEPVDFTIKLTGCSAGGVTLTFTGETDTNDNSLLALNNESTASGVAVEIMDSAHQRLPLNEESKPVDVDDNGNVRLNFSARYISTSDRVTAGTANADSLFTLSYD